MGTADEDGKIVAVGPDAEIARPEDATVIDAQGCWVLPGFIGQPRAEAVSAPTMQ